MGFFAFKKIVHFTVAVCAHGPSFVQYLGGMAGFGPIIKYEKRKQSATKRESPLP